METARILDEAGAKFFGVSNVEEGIALRQAGFTQEILLFETTLPELAESIVDYGLTPTVCNLELARALNSYAAAINAKVNVHIKVDTAMARLGVTAHDFLNFIDELLTLDHLRLQGIYTHFASADCNDELTLRQIQDFFNLLEKLKAKSINIPYIHAANSAGLVGFKNFFFNLARPGLMLYGLYPNDEFKRKISLKPALSVKSKIIFLKKIAQGQGISYGHSFIAQRDMTVAVLPIGYNDGYFRAFSNKAHVLIDAVRCPVVGRVTMDQTIVDVTGVASPQLGMPVVILGEQNGLSITANDLADWAQTISYEIVCALGNRLPRHY